MAHSARRQIYVVGSALGLIALCSGCGGTSSPSGKEPPVASSSMPTDIKSNPSVPRIVLGSPIGGAGNTLTASVTFHDDAGQLNLEEFFFLINDPSRGADGTGACVTRYKRSSGDVYLLDDAGKSWLGPHKAGSKTVLVNSQCLVSLANIGLAETNGDLQWVIAVGFSPKFLGIKNVYAKAINRQKLESNFALLGVWTAK